MESFVIKTPCSSANIGPGFDVIGLALSVYLELHVTIDRSKEKSEHPLNCRVTYEGEGEDDISLDPQSNLLTRVALYVLRCHGQRSFPVETHVHIKNPIPLGRGLGSSGAAVVAGVMLGKEVGQLKHLDNDRLFDYCLMIGGQPFMCLFLSLIVANLAIRTTPRQRWRRPVRRLCRHLSDAPQARRRRPHRDSPQ